MKGGAVAERVSADVVGEKLGAAGDRVIVVGVVGGVVAATAPGWVRCFWFLRRLSLACRISCRRRIVWRRFNSLLLLLLLFICVVLLLVELVSVLATGVPDVRDGTNVGASAERCIRGCRR